MSGALERRSGWRETALVAAVAVAASITGLCNRFAFDDVRAVVQNERVHSLADPGRFLAEPYWPQGKFTGGATLYRPLTSFAAAVQWTTGGGHPMPFHAVNVLLYALVCVLFLRLAASLLPAVPAVIAAALFAAHPVHVEAVGNIVGQGELWTNLFMLLGLGIYLSGRSPAGLRPRERLLTSLCYLLACLSKDNGFVFPGLLLAAEITVVNDPRPLRDRLRSLAPLGAQLAAVALLYVLARTTVTGSLAGDYPHILIGTATYPERLFTMLRVGLEWPRLLLWPAHLQADYSPQDFARAGSFGPWQALGLGMILAAGALAWWARRRAPLVTFSILWLAVAIFPVSNLVLKTGIVLAERTLFLASAGAMLLVGAAVSPVLSRRPAWKPATLALAAIVTLLGTWRSAIRQPAWRDSGTIFAQSVQDAPRNYRVHWTYGIYLYEQGARESAFREIATAIELFPADPSLYADAGDLYRTDGQCDRSIPLYTQALALTPELQFTRSRLASCYLRTGRFAEARNELRRLVSEGAPQFGRFLPAVDSAAAATGTFQ